MSDTTLSQQPSALKRGLGFVRQRLRGRPDSEHEQAIVRIVIVAILATYYATLAWLYDFSDLRYAPGPGRRGACRLTAMVTDLTTLAVLPPWGQEAGTPLYPIYLWITLGNGF